MALTPLHVQDVCCGHAKNPYNGGNSCKYLCHEVVGKKVVALCMKKATSVIIEKAKNGQLPQNWNKLPDNCPGYRYMKHIDQGYNIP